MYSIRANSPIGIVTALCYVVSIINHRNQMFCSGVNIICRACPNITMQQYRGIVDISLGPLSTLL